MNKSYFLPKYKEQASSIIKRLYPDIDQSILNDAIDYSINKRLKNNNAIVHNNFTNSKMKVTLLQLADYITKREPIITASGVMFKRHSQAVNPIAKLFETYTQERDDVKRIMFQYPKGSENFERYNLLQTVAKVSNNGMYGVLTLHNSFFYNMHVASSITGQGRSLVSTAAMFFESFLANSVKFSNIDEVLIFINNVCNEHRSRTFNDKIILDRNISIQECFVKIGMSCGFEWIPTEEELCVIFDTIKNLGQEDLNRVFYKNNLYEFLSNSNVISIVLDILDKLETPFLNPYEPPEEITEELKYLTALFKEYVYYGYFHIDPIERFVNMIRNIIYISDTDSTIVYVGAWHNYVADIVRDRNLDFKVMHMTVDGDALVNSEDPEKFTNNKFTSYVKERVYDFYNDKVIEVERENNKGKIIQQDTLRYCIINIMSNILTTLIGDYMLEYTKQSNSYEDGKKCLIIMKNELLIKSALISHGKKNYALIQEVQEGSFIKDDENHPGWAITGLSINKSTMNKYTTERLTNILFEDILATDKIDQFTIISKLAILEEDIKSSLRSGSTDFAKPANFKAINSYDDPYRIQPIRGAFVWNTVAGEEDEQFNLKEPNYVNVIATDINKNNIKLIKDKFPDRYKKFIKIIGNPDDKSDKGIEMFSGKITSISLPKNRQIPEWLLDFIDYTSIVNYNLANFPLEHIGINRGDSKNTNYSNILSL